MELLGTLHTGGDSLWSDGSERRVSITKFLVRPFDNADFGELRVFFDPKAWDVYERGLIYTDTLFLLELREHLKLFGVDVSNLDYSEQGMQGDDYVSLDVDNKFIASWKAQGFDVEEN